MRPTERPTQGGHSRSFGKNGPTDIAEIDRDAALVGRVEVRALAATRPGVRSWVWPTI
ncbi:hypothetical protein JW916_06440 [Candidatus Sumerlaeota bacterium]|nr:hypothetical protein [Candidatus Sumerlaeota bacterium]